MTALIFKSQREIVITDYVDYLVLHVTIRYTGIFSRKFSVVLYASLAIKCRVSIRISSIWFYIDSSVQQTKYYGKKVSTLRYILNKYFLFLLNMIEIQQKVKLVSLKISKVFHPQNTDEFLKMLQHLKIMFPLVLKVLKKFYLTFLSH